MFGALHAIFGVMSLLPGGWVFLLPKGTRLHVGLGWGYVASMVCLNGSGLCIFRLTGGLNLFHGLAVASLLMVTAGVLQVRYRTRIRHWLWRHYHYMAWSYVGLVAATGNEAFVRVSFLRRLAASLAAAPPLLFSALVLAGAAAVIFSKQRRVLSRYGRGGADPVAAAGAKE